MKQCEYVDRAGWTWEIDRFRDAMTADEEWTAGLWDGPWAGHGEACGPCDTRKELEALIEGRVALLVEILAEREAGL